MVMIRRILVFLAILFVLFFAWRRYDKSSADGFLQKIKKFSFKNNNSYTTTIINPDGTTGVIGTTGLVNIVEDTLTDKSATGSSTSSIILQQILNQSTLEDTVQQPVVQVEGLSNGVIVNTGPIETLDANPTKETTTTTKVQPTVVNTSSETTTSTLSDQDRSEMNAVMQLFH